jgi:membrane-associated PAP2 superfamily phosphatase
MPGLSPSFARRLPGPGWVHHPGTWLLAVLAFTLAWDMTALDQAVMGWIGSPAGFAWRHDWLLERVLHDAARQCAILAFVCLWAWALWPRGWTPRQRAGEPTLPLAERTTVALLVTLALLAVNLVKNRSLTSCPWDLEVFGGTLPYVSHWQAGVSDGGPGRCFPGGHASSAFSFLAVSLPWLLPPPGRERTRRPGLYRLGVVMALGILLGAVQTVRGAHHPSHTLWTLAICATVAVAGWTLARPWLARTGRQALRITHGRPRSTTDHGTQRFREVIK